jgi:hypothetical protein
MLRVCLVFSSMRLGVPFIAPRQLGAVESNPGRQFLPSIGWRTGHCPVLIALLFWCSRPLKIWSRWCTGHCPVHTEQSGAPIRPLARPRVTRGLRGRPLAWPTVGSPDSPVHHRTVRCIIAIRHRRIPKSSLFTRASLAHRTVRCTQTEQQLAVHSQLFFLLSFLLILALRQIC